MSDVSGNTLFSESVSENDVYESETENGADNVVESEVEPSDVSANNTDSIESVEGEVIDNEEWIFETVDVSNNGTCNTSDYSNYLSFLIAVVLGLGAVICWAKGFTE